MRKRLYNIYKEIWSLEGDTKIIAPHFSLDKFEFRIVSDITDYLDSLNDRTLSERLLQNFESHNLPLVQSAAVAVEEVGKRWRIDDDNDGYLYVIKKEKDSLHVCSNKYGFSRKTREEMKEITLHGALAYRSDRCAVSFIEGLLISLTVYARTEEVYDVDVDLDSTSFKESNIISICAPPGNPITGELWENLGIQSPFSVKEDGIRVALNWDKTEYVPELKGQELVTDYGVIYKRRSPLTPKERYIFIFAGGRAYGTQGSAAALTIAKTVDTIFCEGGTRTDEFSLPIKVESPNGKPLYQMRNEMLVSCLQPKTSSYENAKDAVATISELSTFQPIALRDLVLSGLGVAMGFSLIVIGFFATLWFASFVGSCMAVAGLLHLRK
jgi:hypothetical protein